MDTLVGVLLIVLVLVGSYFFCKYISKQVVKWWPKFYAWQQRMLKK